MHIHKGTVATIGMGILTVSTLVGCSNDTPMKELSPIPKVEDTSVEPSPSTSETTDDNTDIDEGDFRYYDQDEIVWEYNIELSDFFEPEVIANFETDVNALYHLMLGGGFVDFTQSYSGENYVRLEAVRPYLTTEAFEELEDAYEEHIESPLANYLIAQVTPEGEIKYSEEETFSVVDRNERVPIFMEPWGENEIRVFNTGEGGQGVYVERDVINTYNTSEGAAVWKAITASYTVQPNADGKWIIGSWGQEVHDHGVLYE